MSDKEKKMNRFEQSGKRVAKFFIELKAELKKVVWPDRKKLIQSTVTVLTICLIMAVLVFIIDNVLRGSLNTVGFFPQTSSSSTTTSQNTGLPTIPPVVPSKVSSQAVSSSQAAASSQVVTSSQSSASTTSK
jgi:preprotein translocase subunit SecE